MIALQPSRDEENAYVAGTCLLYGTVSGSIGAVLNLTPEGFNLFNVVEKAMEKVVQGVGGLKHSDWRAFRYVVGLYYLIFSVYFVVVPVILPRD